MAVCPEETHRKETHRKEMHQVEICQKEVNWIELHQLEIQLSKIQIAETPDNKEELLEKEKTVVYYNAMRKSTEREHEYGFRAML